MIWDGRLETPVDHARAAVSGSLEVISSGYRAKVLDLIETLIQRVRDEEFKLHELKEKCRWDGGIECESCPCNKTRYCA